LHPVLGVVYPQISLLLTANKKSFSFIWYNVASVQNTGINYTLGRDLITAVNEKRNPF